MAKELVAVLGLTISHSSGSLMSGGSFIVTSTPSLKLFAESNGAYSGTLNFTFSGGNYSGGVSNTGVGSGTIIFTATKLKDGASFVLREGDSGSMTGVYGNPSAPPPTLPYTTNVEISDAGQTKLLSE